MRLVIHPRIARKHPELGDADVRAAFLNMFRHVYRPDGTLVGVGMDTHQRLLEVIAKEGDGCFIIFHAFSPPTTKVMREIGMLR